MAHSLLFAADLLRQKRYFVVEHDIQGDKGQKGG
jgi:hypothetical protein